MILEEIDLVHKRQTGPTAGAGPEALPARPDWLKMGCVVWRNNKSVKSC